jgi:hypothetical protein
MKIDNGTGGSRETSTGGPGSRPGRRAVDERERESINFFAELKRRNAYKAHTNKFSPFRAKAGWLESARPFSYLRSMSSEAAKLLQRFDQLPLQEQKELSAAILKRTTTFDYEEPSDEELTAAAARVFEVLDQEEDDAASR